MKLACAIAIALSALASAALAADPGAAPAKPTACETYAAPSTSNLMGRWSLKQRDDGHDWAGPWNIEFKPDGTWLQGDNNVGFWCQNGDIVFFGFSDDPHTTYRGLLGVGSIQGVESWNGGGTGIFEANRIN